MSRHTLFLLKPGFQDGDEGPWFCPYTAAVEGFLSFVPELEDRLDVRRIDFERPRPEVVELLGADHQGTPSLVLAEGASIPEAAEVSDVTGRAFLLGEMPIMRYLSHEFGVMKPH